MTLVAEATVRTVHPGCWSDRHWLEHCEGFRVESLDRSLGIVDQVFPDAQVLWINAGGHTVTVPFERIRLIDPSAERVVLADRA